MDDAKQKVADGFGLYMVLTGPLRGYEYLVSMAVAHDIAFVQLRMKDVPPQIVRRTALSLRLLTINTKTKLIINDDPELARDTQADGVHVGQDDMPYGAVRRIVGPAAIIGLSTHSPAQTQSACLQNVDYIGVGPVFTTPTKQIPDPPLGLDTMKQMVALSTVPAVAIGGIGIAELPAVLAAGARNFCMVRPLCQSNTPEKVLIEVLKIWRDYREG